MVTCGVWHRITVMEEDSNFPYCGHTFASYEDFNRELKASEKNTQHVFTICRSVSIESGNKALYCGRILNSIFIGCISDKK